MILSFRALQDLTGNSPGHSSHVTLNLENLSLCSSQTKTADDDDEDEEEGRKAVSSLHDSVFGLVAVKDAPFETQSVLASCNALAILDGELVGDPLEKAAIHAISWTVGKGVFDAKIYSKYF